MAYTYTTFVDALVAESNIPITNAGLVAALPTIIDQAEGMIYREPTLNFLSTEVVDDTGFATPNNQQFTLPRHFTVLDQVNLVQGNDRIPLQKTTREWLQAVFTRRIANSPSDVPGMWAPLTETIAGLPVILLGPTPGGAPQLECIGTARPANLSASNPNTWLWTYLGDLAFAAAMVFTSAYMRNFGAQADNPQMALSWKAVYDGLMPGASSEEMRRKREASS